MDFSKIKWAGEDCVLVTSTEDRDPKIPILILTKHDIKKLNKEWEK